MHGQAPFKLPTATIAASAALSGAVYIGAGRVVGIVTPSGWDAADITFQASVDGVTYNDVYIDSADTEVTIQAAASRHIRLATPLAGVPWLKVRSGTTGSPVNQADAVVVTVVVESIPS